jgi:hypothetical protein
MVLCAKSVQVARKEVCVPVRQAPIALRGTYHRDVGSAHEAHFTAKKGRTEGTLFKQLTYRRATQHPVARSVAALCGR